MNKDMDCYWLDLEVKISCDVMQHNKHRLVYMEFWCYNKLPDWTQWSDWNDKANQCLGLHNSVAYQQPFDKRAEYDWQSDSCRSKIGSCFGWEDMLKLPEIFQRNSYMQLMSKLLKGKKSPLNKQEISFCTSSFCSQLDILHSAAE